MCTPAFPVLPCRSCASPLPTESPSPAREHPTKPEPRLCYNVCDGTHKDPPGVRVLTPRTLLTTAVVATTLLVGWALRRWWLSAREASLPIRLAIVLLRVGIYGGLLLAVANPAVVRPYGVQQPHQIVVLLDASASMALPGSGAAARWAEAQGALQAAAQSSGGGLTRFEKALFADGSVGAPAADGPTGEMTNLDLALRQIAATRVPSTLVVISDGAFTHGDAPGVAAQLHRQGFTVHAVGVGRLDPPPDAAILAVEAPQRVPEHTSFSISVLANTPDAASNRDVSISRADRVVRKVPVPRGRQPQRVRVAVPGLPAGTHLFTVDLPSVPGEATSTNNRRSFFVEAFRDRNRIRLVASAPGLEFANLRRALLDLPQTELHSWVRVGRDRYLAQTATTTRPAAISWPAVLRGCHVLMLLDVPQAQADAAVVRRFVREGGALALLGGRQAAQGSDWSDLAPLVTGPYEDVPVGVGAPDGTTGLGAALLGAIGTAAWRGAPHLTGANRVVRVQQDAQIVLRTRQARPLMATRPYGLGRCLSLATDGTHRWVLSPEADEGSRFLHRRFWSQVVVWLAAPRDETDVALMLDPPVVASGQPARALVQVSHGLSPVASAQVLVKLQSPQGPVTLVATPTSTPGRYQVSLSELPAGKHEVVAEARAAKASGTARATLVVEPGGAEFADLTLQKGALQRLAAAGGGQYAALDQLPRLLSSPRTPPQTQTETRLTTPFRSLWAFLALLTMCALDWFLRRRHGL